MSDKDKITELLAQIDSMEAKLQETNSYRDLYMFSAWAGWILLFGALVTLWS